MGYHEPDISARYIQRLQWMTCLTNFDCYTTSLSSITRSLRFWVIRTFDASIDESLRDTFKCADEAMYIEKKRQKGITGGEIR